MAGVEACCGLQSHSPEHALDPLRGGAGLGLGFPASFRSRGAIGQKSSRLYKWVTPQVKPLWFKGRCEDVTKFC
jgi:hypothetical protein